MTLDFPLTFSPILKERIWGGDKLTTVFKKGSEKTGIGESWELSDVEGDISIVSNGPLEGKSLKNLIKTYKGKLVGEKVYEAFGNSFPILIKYIDAKTPLSIQVHPSNELAKTRHNSFGKNEMWYIMEAEENAECIAGDILRGNKKPFECLHFGKKCNPENPLGAPMVSSEGACAAYYNFSHNLFESIN